MDSNVILKDKSAVVLLNELANSPALRAQIEAYFTPYCDCDITEWVVARVIANDQAVKNKLREMIAARDFIPVVRGATKPVAGQLLKGYCVGEDFVGIYADGNGGEIQKTIEIGSFSQGCKQLEDVQIYFPLISQESLVRSGSSNVTYSSYPENNDPNNSVISSLRFYDSQPSIPRLQFKLGDLAAGDYENLSVEIFSVYGADGGYSGPHSKCPYNTARTDWNGAVTAVYNSSSRIVKIEAETGAELDGNVIVTILKNNRILAWAYLYATHFDTDPVTGANTPFNAMSLIVF